MAVRQYVGARYVPKWHQNSQNPIYPTWEGNTPYEAMTNVTYNNSTYSSKIPVPAGIGNPADNPTYWVCTADYNAQVEQYRQQIVQTESNLKDQMNQLQTTTEETIDTVNGDITNLKAVTNKPHYVWIGDSYSNFSDYYLGEHVRDGLCIPEGRWHTAYQGGAGFVNKWTGATFNDLLNRVAGTMSDDAKNNVSNIFIAGGANDITNAQGEVIDPNLILGAMRAFANNAQTLFPSKPLITYFFIGVPISDMSKTNTYVKNMLNYFAYSSASGIGVQFLWPYTVPFTYRYIEDKTHPTIAQLGYIKTTITNIIAGGNNDKWYTDQRIDGTLTDNYSVDHGSLHYVIKPNTSYIYSLYFKVINSQGTLPAVEGGNRLLQWKEPVFNDTSFILPTYVPYSQGWANITPSGGQTKTIQVYTGYEGNQLGLYTADIPKSELTTYTSYELHVDLRSVLQ